MDNKQLIEMITAYSEAYGPSGYEHEVAEIAIQHTGDYGKVVCDTLQNVYVHRGDNTGSRLKVQLDAHLDEVGLIVQSIRSNGMLGVLPLGSWVPGNIPAHLFRVRTRDGKWVRAIATSKPPHYLTEAEKTQKITMDQIELDIGASSKQEVEEAFGIDLAAPVVPDVSCFYDEPHDLLLGKAFDCRLGCAAMTETMKSLDGEELQVDLVAAFSVQEEIGGRGAIVTARQIGADLAIVFEGTPADDNFASAEQGQTALGKGPMLRHMDRSMVTHPGFQRYTLELARKSGIPVQEAVRSGGGTNGGLIHTQGAGIPTIVIGVPVRYIHTHYGWAKLGDVKAAVSLATALLKSFDATALERLIY
ncbi:MAG TPA: M20/M25/M40 family metallo-hydrolase [Clostridia bacterium]|nr:M20/M25/M40 family metallo-hydrolase [Clostridia bacterium]